MIERAGIHFKRPKTETWIYHSLCVNIGQLFFYALCLLMSKMQAFTV